MNNLVKNLKIDVLKKNLFFFCLFNLFYFRHNIQKYVAIIKNKCINFRFLIQKQNLSLMNFQNQIQFLFRKRLEDLSNHK